jgi:tRNA (guanine37-N1)-methyltransferase
VDDRVRKILKADEYSVGDYTVTGGELPALIMTDAIARQIPGVLGKGESVEETRIASPRVYTRPETLVYKGKKHKVPTVLLNGDHKKIDEWRKKQQK